ncbi:MAG: methylated-DNA--[protein]-cysteine S-methyltransferase [Holosporaceae bacterium]|jgi:methylated-DNA-[protein]-cysteine S-methyltransferase|nr:methylated-DNA--[protein]-cysteine S-methyltransferase [Holosporaceae bacterium]
MNYFCHETILGKITICNRKNAVVRLYFGSRHFPEAKNVESGIIQKAFVQLAEYLDGYRCDFDFELAYDGSNFQTSVWNQLKLISYGQTKSYKDIASLINSPKSSLAVGNACGKNPIPIFIPCHRVVGSDGDLRGYAVGISLKKKLLEIENWKKCD